MHICSGGWRTGLRKVAAVASVALLVWSSGGTAVAQSLRSEIELAVSTAKLGPSKVGISVLDCATGETLANVNGDEALLPASNMKVLTTGAALFALGPDFEFRTMFQLEGSRLIIKGDGDPALGDPEVLAHAEQKMTVDQLVAAIVGAVKKAEVTSLDEVIVDDRVFDRERVHPSWPAEQLNAWYCAEVSGVNFHANMLKAFPRASEAGAGRPPTIRTQPEVPWLEIDTSRSRSVKEGNNSSWLRRSPKENRFQLVGEVPMGPAREIETTLWDPATFFGELIAYNLMRENVQIGRVSEEASGGGGVGGRTQSWRSATRLAAEADRFDPDRTLVVVTTPIADVLRRCNADSHNMYAEALLKRVAYKITGEPGSWESGASVLRMLLTEKLGPQYAADTQIGDGSGMSRLNKVAPATLTKWMRELVNDEKTREAFVKSLPKPGEGTLERRFRGRKLAHEVHGKSGYIRGVRCLSGLVIDRERNRTIAYSVLVNYDPRFGKYDAAALELHEAVAVAIDQWLTRQRR